MNPLRYNITVSSPEQQKLGMWDNSIQIVQSSPHTLCTLSSNGLF